MHHMQYRSDGLEPRGNLLNYTRKFEAGVLQDIVHYPGTILLI